jgi:hypothetical protein
MSDFIKVNFLEEDGYKNARTYIFPRACLRLLRNNYPSVSVPNDYMAWNSADADRMMGLVSREEYDRLCNELGVYEEQEQMNPILLERIESDEFDFALRTVNCLRAEGIRYIGELVQWEENKLLRTPNLGRKSLSEIKEKLRKHSLTFSMAIKDWTRPDKELGVE